MLKHLSVRIVGNVQGVFFRDSARRTAEQLGLSGFARNEASGTVYIEAEGDEKALERFLAWCRQGPSRAKVQRAEYSYSSDMKDFYTFVIQ
jgi:acylphosphatase